MLKSNNPIRVMVVEDDPMVCRINEGFLAKIPGFIHAGSYTNIEKAKEAILATPPALVLLDVYFLGEGAIGLDFIRWIRRYDLNVDVVFITADDQPDTINQALRFGAVDYLIKPFKFERFEKALLKYQKMVSGLKGHLSVEQSAIDHMLVSDYESERPEQQVINKTYNDMVVFLTDNSQQAYTAGELAEHLGISRITARRYLDRMEKEGSVTMTLVYGHVGRPNNCYKWKG